MRRVLFGVVAVCASVPMAGPAPAQEATTDAAAKQRAAVLAKMPAGHRNALGQRTDAAKVLATQTPLWTATLHEPPEKPRAVPVGAVQFAPDGRSLIAIGQEGAGKKFETVAWKEKTPLIDATVGVATVAWDARTKYYATSGSDGALRIWRAKSGKKHRFFEGSDDAVYAVAFGAKGKLVAAAGLDGRARVWGTAKGRERCSVSGYGFGLRAIAFAPDGKSFVTAGVSEMLEHWQVDGGTSLRRVKIGPETTEDGEDFICWSLSVAPDGTRVVAGGSDGKVRLVDLESGAVKWSLPRHTGGVFAVAFAPSGDLIASTGLGGEVRLLNAADGATKRTLKIDAHAGFALGWAPKWPYLATIGNDAIAKVWVVPELVTTGARK